MAKTAQDLITITRNVTGRVDRYDPLFTDDVMLQYINDFIQHESTQDIRINKNQTWYEFTIDENSDDPYPVDLDSLQLSTIGPKAYVNGFRLFWYQDPEQFYVRWPETQTYDPQRPTSVLYYNNELTFRGPPDDSYDIKINAYKWEVAVSSTVDLSEDYLFRYVSYGAALDIFADYGEIDRVHEYLPIYERYRNLVYARTYQQNQNQRSNPEF